jgi:hypothetical protein
MAVHGASGKSFAEVAQEAEHTHRVAWRQSLRSVEAMEWAEIDGADYIFGLGGNTALDALVAETADNFALPSCPEQRIRSCAPMRASRTRPTVGTVRARWWRGWSVRCSRTAERAPQPACADIRHVITSLDGTARYHYEDVYCRRGRMENLINWQSDPMSCHSATANQVRLVLHTAAFWLMWRTRRDPADEPTGQG